MHASAIHPTALIHPEARIGQAVAIGPWCQVEGGTVIGDRCVLEGRVTIKTGTRLGADNRVAEGAVLGGRPQHLRAGEEVGELHIGDGNTIREYVTMHCGLKPGSRTVVGSHNMIMVNSHIAHDCLIADHTIMANNVMLAGHVVVASRAYLSGAVGVHQFCRIGAYAMVGGQAHITRDVPPFITVDGLSSLVVGLNIVGLRRAGFSDAQLQELKRAYRLMYRRGLTWAATLQLLEQEFTSGPAMQLWQFLREGKRGFVQERRMPRLATVRMPQPSANDSGPPELRRIG